ncbi:PhnD/SsuA/transferrin family substrate-binding protein [Aquamicrobium sp. LC103]|uniref:phosphate/phosphite/phosphonate ABC transporter substrate-binding protein n=1 Tax=Aquamicrobium sp. LC103 TaxID=1120658 RepID=UPI00063EADCD|nr:PhnD/SsuA/transferrin family substrate-binding protein [Aquamicrobium sp. LC103]TKT80036.1 phosphate ABC transporter substrate-binding protein [Aquamicrobium sp. LC103]
MSEFIAALPMYDWPERREEVDAEWRAIRDRLRGQGIAAPERLTRRNADMPSVPGGIRDAGGALIAPDPATLPSDELDLPTLWRHPGLLFAQACWGPLEAGLSGHVRVLGQPDYSAFDGGQGESYSSAILTRREGAAEERPPADGYAILPLDLLAGRRLAYNSPDSMSGIIALTRDLETLGEDIGTFAARIETGGHRASIRAVAEGRADICAIDCRSWAMARRFDPAARALSVVGWTARRKGLPYVASRLAPHFSLFAEKSTQGPVDFPRG